MHPIERDEARYPVAVHRMPGFYLARVKNLPGCICRGATPIEAVMAVREALRAHLQVTRVLPPETAVLELEIKA